MPVINLKGKQVYNFMLGLPRSIIIYLSKVIPGYRIFSINTNFSALYPAIKICFLSFIKGVPMIDLTGASSLIKKVSNQPLKLHSSSIKFQAKHGHIIIIF